MYNQVNLTVSPSFYLQTAAWLIVIATLVVLISLPSTLLSLKIIILMGIVGYSIRLYFHGFIYQQTRHWQLKMGELFLIPNSDLNSDGRCTQGQKVDLINTQTFYGLSLFTYKKQSKLYREIICIDGVDHEAFRQFRCMIKSI